MSAHTNRLIHETSPYLLQHAHNPVDWHPYSPEIFIKAAAENKPILFSIGYSACHWCHVMEHESFENEAIAETMNKHFICVKVDREERPDVDHLYMDAVQLLSGRGGWPLNCFALPDGRPFWGGTYFGSEQWSELLLQISAVYNSRYSDLVDQAEQITKGIAGNGVIEPLKGELAITPVIIEGIIHLLSQNFDKTNGGFSGAPKFPMPGLLDFLLRTSATGRYPAIQQQLDLTLNKMAKGGIYDQVGGGFARYSVDSEWKVPHFEKMLYDNAQLVSLYANALKLSGTALFREVAEQTLEFIERELTSPEGLFYSAIDADSEGEEGLFYTWTAEEFEETLGQYGKLLGEFYGVGKEGLWENSRNILVRSFVSSLFAQQHFLSEPELEALLQHGRNLLLRKRDTRVRPGLDDKILTSWNALMIKAYVDAYHALGQEGHLSAAIKAAKRLLLVAGRKDGGLFHSSKNGTSHIDGFLDDYALLAEACLALYKASLDEGWKDESIRLTEYALASFYDPVSGMFYYSEDNNQKLPRKFETYDGVIPSSNSVLADVLVSLSILTGNEKYRLISDQMTDTMVRQAETHPASYSGWCSLLLNRVQPQLVIAVIGEKAKEKLSGIHKHYLPFCTITGSTIPSGLPYLNDRYSEGRTLIYVCTDNSCLPPLESTEEAVKCVRTFGNV
jgi:uncharacterized protein